MTTAVGKGSGALDTSNVQVGSTKKLNQGSHIDDRIVEEPPTVAIQAEVPPMDQMELERFMNEELEVLIHEPMQEGEPAVVETEVGGCPMYIKRGVPQLVRRKYVEVLARARDASVRHSYKLQGDEAKNFQSFSNRALTFPFVVNKDPSGAVGQNWLAAILAG